MKTFAGVLTTVLVVGLALLLWGCFSYPRELELAVAGAILIGSWLLSISIIQSSSS
jgi:starvation-inducible outer membrane lipoprotein